MAVSRAALADLVNQLEVPAEFHPYQEVEVHAKIAGYVKQINVDVGDRVRQGQVLAVLEAPEMADDQAQALAARRRSEAELVRAKSDLQRAERSHTATHLANERLSAVLKTRPNLVAQQEIDEALSRDQVAEEQVSAAKASIDAAEQQVQSAIASQQKVETLLNYSRIVAPFSGVVTKRYADTGAMIQAGTASQTQTMPLVRISQNERLRLALQAPESAAPLIRIGSQVQVRVETLGQTFEGHVSRFAGRVNPSTRTMETEIDVPNPKLILMPGMFATAVLTLSRRPNALTVPVQAVADRDTKPSVLVVDDRQRIELRGVKLGIESASKIEILDGLRQGEMVVVGNRSGLLPGQRVQAKVMDMSMPKGVK